MDGMFPETKYLTSPIGQVNCSRITKLAARIRQATFACIHEARPSSEHGEILEIGKKPRKIDGNVI
jgi:hypothetical protein